MFHLAARRGERSASQGGRRREGKGRERRAPPAKEKEERGKTGIDRARARERERVQGHECEGYRTSLLPGRANLSGTVRRHARFSTLGRRRSGAARKIKRPRWRKERKTKGAGEREAELEGTFQEPQCAKIRLCADMVSPDKIRPCRRYKIFIEKIIARAYLD